MTRSRPSRLFALLGVLLIGLLPLVLGQSVTYGQHPDGTDDVPILTVEEAFELGAEWYASYFDTSMEAARLALAL